MSWLGDSLRTLAEAETPLRHVAQPALTVRDRLMRRRDGERILRERHHALTGRELDLDAPEAFIDKLYWRMVSQQRRADPRLTACTDKYLVRDYVRSVLGDDYLIPLYWHGTDPARIPFDSLPSQYVVKSNHASSHVIRVDGEVRRDEVVAQATAWMRENYYWVWREEQYYRIRPRILVEGYLDDGYAAGPLDYRFYCFSGEPALIQVSDHVLDLHVFFDTDWHTLDVRFREGGTYDVAQPPNLDEMISAAVALARPFDFVRVDLYNLHGDIRFGELTFTPSAGHRLFEPEPVEQALGQLWPLGDTTPAALGSAGRRRRPARLA
jgi:protein associated with RNAse G/E